MSDSIFKYQLPTETAAKLAALLENPTYTDTSATPGDGTASTYTGRSSIAIGDNEAIITNTLVYATSVVLVTLETLDATATLVKCVPANGSFTVTANANATAVTKFRWALQK